MRIGGRLIDCVDRAGWNFLSGECCKKVGALPSLCGGGDQLFQLPQRRLRREFRIIRQSCKINDLAEALELRVVADRENKSIVSGRVGRNAGVPIAEPAARKLIA